MKTVRVFEYEKELEYYLLNIQPLSIDYDLDGNRFFTFEYKEWKKLYIQTLEPIKK